MIDRVDIGANCTMTAPEAAPNLTTPGRIFFHSFEYRRAKSKITPEG